MRKREADAEVVVIGAEWHPLRDAYHFVLSAPWWGVLGVIVGGFYGVNVLYALVYLFIGGIEGMRPGSALDAFFFSVQTMGTIGYGAMHPVTDAANFVVVSEAAVGLVVTALATGIVFARFSRTPEQLVFSRNATVSNHEGVPTLAFRIGNDRASTVIEARVKVNVVRTEHPLEGGVFYRLHEARLLRERSPALSRSWTVLHPIEKDSPLFGVTERAALEEELEIMVTVVGTDDVSLQPVTARYTYKATDLAWGAQLADVLSELPDGRLQLDIRRFHDTVPAKR